MAARASDGVWVFTRKLSKEEKVVVGRLRQQVRAAYQRGVKERKKEEKMAARRLLKAAQAAAAAAGEEGGEGGGKRPRLDAATLAMGQRAEEMVQAARKRRALTKRLAWQHGQQAPGPRIVIDMRYDELMKDAEISSMGDQLRSCYAAARTSEQNVRMMILGPGERTVPKAYKTQELASWKRVVIDARPFEDYFAAQGEDERPKEVIYLTADSDNVIDAFENDTAYVIGGLVDRNRHKGIALETAQRVGVKTARLPLDDYVTHMTTRVLTVNHVFELICARQNNQSWTAAFAAILPERKMRDGEILEKEEEEAKEEEAKEEAKEEEEKK